MMGRNRVKYIFSGRRLFPKREAMGSLILPAVVIFKSSFSNQHFKRESTGSLWCSLSQETPGTRLQLISAPRALAADKL